MIFVFGTYKHKKRLPEATLGRYSKCCVHCELRRAGTASPVVPIEHRKTCHFCFIPLVPGPAQRVVVCTTCRKSVSLEVHLQQWTAIRKAEKKRRAAAAAKKQQQEEEQTPDESLSSTEASDLAQTEVLVEMAELEALTPVEAKGAMIV